MKYFITIEVSKGVPKNAGVEPSKGYPYRKYFPHGAPDMNSGVSVNCASMEQTLRIKVSGKVQGVFFRQSTCETASALGIGGTVRNCEDGSVEIVATGEETILHHLVEWCRKGPSRAKVNEVLVDKLPLRKHVPFCILR